MLVPCRHAPAALLHNPVPGIMPAAKHLLATLPASRRSAGIHFTTPKIFALFGLPNTGRLIGPVVLHSVLRRPICGISKRETPPAKTMIEPYAAAIRSLEPEMWKLGYMKIHEEQFLTLFSDGLYKIAIRRNPKEPQNEYFIDRNNCAHSIRRLKFQFNSDAENQLEAAARHALIEKYGLLNNDTPTAIAAKGIRACAVFDLTQSIKFLETHQEALCKLLHPSEETLASARAFTLKSGETSSPKSSPESA